MTELHFICEMSSLELAGATADVLGLNDGRVIVIDGETLTIFEDLESVLDPEDDANDHERPTLPLVIED